MEEDFSKRSGKLKPIFIDAISELVDELGMVREQIAAQAMEHIHSACV
jgi:translation initiation factor eIF-2B subunit beta